MHPRASIRKYVTQLLSGQTACDDRVYPSRARSLWNEELPAILVYTKTEAAEIFSTAPMELKRTLQVVIEVVDKADDCVDERLDQIARCVEKAIAADETLSERVEYCGLKNTEMDIIADGDNLTGSCRMTFETTYYTLEPELTDAVLDPFEGVDSKIKITDSVADTAKVQDKIDLPQT